MEADPRFPAGGENIQNCMKLRTFCSCKGDGVHLLSINGLSTTIIKIWDLESES